MNIPAIVSRIRYKPGYTFYVDDSGDIVVRAMRPNAYPRGPRRVPVFGYVIEPWRYRTEQHLLEQVREAIESIDRHEQAEWFKYRGRRHFYTGH